MYFLWQVKSKTMAKSVCSFNTKWLEQFSWLREDPKDKHSAKCTLCDSSIFLSNMGRRAITSHQRGTGHKRRENRASISGKFSDFLNRKDSGNSDEKIDITAAMSSDAQIKSISASTVPNTEVNSGFVEACSVVLDGTQNNQKTVSSGIKKYMLKEDITKAEILWCLEAVATHKSLRSAEKDVKMFSHIFTDSQIAKGMQLGRDKMMYYLVFGIAPFFKEILLKDISLCDRFVIGFDESLNKISQRQQMDLNVRYWCGKDNEVKTRYLNSAFLGRSCSNDLIKAFKDAVNPLDLKKLLQLSMDGPNVNLKFFRELSADLKEMSEDPEILNIGSCGLHSVNLSFKTGAKSTNWEIFDFIRAVYYLFKDSPARRALYTYYTNSQEFPKKFCSVRWLENSSVAERCLNILPNIKIFVDKVEKDGNAPSSQSYILIKKLIRDPLLPAKLAFFNSVASEFEIFLREYQTDVPLIPFLFEDLCNLMLRVMKRFIQKDNLKRNPMQIDVEKVSEYVPCNKVDVGISALCHIRKAKVSDGQLNMFYKDCQKFLASCIKKLQERSPLTYELTRAVSCFNPTVTVNQALFEKRLTKLLLILCEKNWLTSIQADRAKSQFQEVCFEANNLAKFKSYNKTHRIDQFWFNILSCATRPCNDAVIVLKMIMLLSHGNSNVERGFSVNKDCLWDNMKEETVVARRIIYDAIQAHGNLNSFQVTKQMILSVRNSRSKYEEEREKKNKQEKENQQNLKRKREAENQLKELQAKKSKILDDAQRESLKIEEEIATIKFLQKKL